MSYFHASFPLAVLLTELEAQMTRAAGDKGVFYSHRYLGTIPDAILTDADRLRGICKDLAQSALHNCDRGFVEISFRHEQERLFITVRDSGSGFRREDVDSLIAGNPWESSRVSRIESLAAARRNCEDLGGNLTLRQTSPEHGSIFEAVVQAPVSSKPFAESERLRPPITGPEEGALANRSILVAEDTADIRFLLTKMLRAAGAIVTTVTSGEEACAEAVRQHYDVVLMDIEMPLMDGLTAAKRLRAEGYRRPIIALTAHGFSEDRQRAIAAGCDEHLTKPIIRPLFLRTVKKFAMGG